MAGLREFGWAATPDARLDDALKRCASDCVTSLGRASSLSLCLIYDYDRGSLRDVVIHVHGAAGEAEA